MAGIFDTPNNRSPFSSPQKRGRPKKQANIFGAMQTSDSNAGSAGKNIFGGTNSPFTSGPKRGRPKKEPSLLGNLNSNNKEVERDAKRSFGVNLQKRTYDRQDGKCYKCHQLVKMSHMEFHHLKAWSKGGKTIADNCVGLCPYCHKDIHDDSRQKEIDKTRKPKDDRPFGFSPNTKPPKSYW